MSVQFGSLAANSGVVQILSAVSAASTVTVFASQPGEFALGVSSAAVFVMPVPSGPDGVSLSLNQGEELWGELGADADVSLGWVLQTPTPASAVANAYSFTSDETSGSAVEVISAVSGSWDVILSAILTNDSGEVVQVSSATFTGSVSGAPAGAFDFAATGTGAIKFRLTDGDSIWAWGNNNAQVSWFMTQVT